VLKEAVYLALFVGVVVLALCSKIDSHHPDKTLLDYLRHPPDVKYFNPLWLALAVASFILARVLLAPAYMGLIRDFYPPPPWRVVAAVAWLSQLGKWVPGKIFTVAGFAWMMRRFGVPVSFGLTTVMLLTGVFVLLGMLLSLPLMFHESLATKVPHGGLLCIVLLAAGAICLHPRVLNAVVNFALRLLRQPPILLTRSRKSYLQLMLNCLVQWLFVGLSTYFMLKSISDLPIDLKGFGVILASSALGTTAGILAFVMPGGLVVREAVMFVVMRAILGPIGFDDEALWLTILGTRVIQIVVEFAMAAVGYLIRRSRKTRELEVLS
jgi:hypothetical protein